MRVMMVMSVLLMAWVGQAFAQDNPKVAAEVIAITKAQWAAEIANDPGKANESIADEYTQFGPNFPVRLDGKALNNRIVEGLDQGGGATLVGEMANEKVQVYGDVAILTYNYIGVTQDKDGATTPALAKSTRVYAKKNGKWMLVHANFAPITSDN